MTKTQKNILFGLLALLIVSLISAIWWGVFASLRGEGSKTETSTSTTEVITDNKDQEVCETKVDGLWNKTIQECDIAFTLEEVKEESEGISLSYQLPRFKEASITAFFERHMNNPANVVDSLRWK